MCDGATGVVAMTWISGRAVVLELPAALGFSCAATTLDAKSHAMGAAHSPRSTSLAGGAFTRRSTRTSPLICRPSPRAELEVDAGADYVFVEAHNRACSASAIPDGRAGGIRQVNEQIFRFGCPILCLPPAMGEEDVASEDRLRVHVLSQPPQLLLRQQKSPSCDSLSYATSDAVLFVGLLHVAHAAAHAMKIRMTPA